MAASRAVDLWRPITLIYKTTISETIVRRFPQARAYVVAGTGHWVHAEKPEIVLRVLHRFLNEA